MTEMLGSQNRFPARLHALMEVSNCLLPFVESKPALSDVGMKEWQKIAGRFGITDIAALSNERLPAVQAYVCGELRKILLPSSAIAATRERVLAHALVFQQRPVEVTDCFKDSAIRRGFGVEKAISCMRNAFSRAEILLTQGGSNETRLTVFLENMQNCPETFRLVVTMSTKDKVSLQFGVYVYPEVLKTARTLDAKGVLAAFAEYYGTWIRLNNGEAAFKFLWLERDEVDLSAGVTFDQMEDFDLEIFQVGSHGRDILKAGIFFVIKNEIYDTDIKKHTGRRIEPLNKPIFKKELI
ncbi:hypothetical protein GN316_15275 [Xylophilus sp. Kf1]|nr:hypothetical protein [Xylophilus sp. Kf1]